MKNTSSPSKAISLFFLLCLSFLSFFCCPAFLHAQCNCPDPIDCTRQPTGGCSTLPANQYFLRYAVNAERGAMTFIGNALGLNKANCVNDVGIDVPPRDITDSIGAFITIDPTQQVGSYAFIDALSTGGPAYTTLDWTKNSSSAVLSLSLPAGSVVLYAELIWSGSYGYFCGNPISGTQFGVDPNCVLGYADGPITFTTPDDVTHLITADSATAIISQNPSLQNLCSQNVTNILNALAAGIDGTYTVGRVPSTVSAYENTGNSAGWTLAIIYHNPSAPFVNNMALFVGGQAGSNSGTPAEVSGFYAQASSPGSARLLVSAVEADPNKNGDEMQFGPTPITLTPLSGPNNPVLIHSANR